MKIVVATALFVFWFVLSGSSNPIHLVTGAVIACLVAWLSPMGPKHVRRLALFKTLLYLPWLAGRILKSGFHVSRLILQPSLPIAPKLINHKTSLASDGELVVLGNSITLTPGTITVEIKPGELVVHSIDEASRKDLEDGIFDTRVGNIFVAKENVQ